MSKSKLSTTKAAVTAFFILLAAVPFQAHAFIFLIPIIASSSDDEPEKAADTMNASDTLKVLVENTAVAELAEGTAYAFFQANGGAAGMHPAHGKLEGNWNVDSSGETCLTWVYPSGSITNCANMSDLGNGKYQWGNRKFTMSKGDVKNLK
jgi:hypothetical protein